MPYSCRRQNEEEVIKDENSLKSLDSAVLYSFFSDKISSTWDYSAENDSVVFIFNQYGLPKNRSETKMINNKSVHLSIEYEYNLSDTTETVRHLQQFGGGQSLLEIRKFGEDGHVLWKEEIDVQHNHKRLIYDEQGLILKTEILE